MNKKSRNLTKKERKVRNEALLKDYDLLVSIGQGKMLIQETLGKRYDLPGNNSVGGIIYALRPSAKTLAKKNQLEKV